MIDGNMFIIGRLKLEIQNINMFHQHANYSPSNFGACFGEKIASKDKVWQIAKEYNKTQQVSIKY